MNVSPAGLVPVPTDLGWACQISLLLADGKLQRIKVTGAPIEAVHWLALVRS